MGRSTARLKWLAAALAEGVAATPAQPAAGNEELQTISRAGPEKALVA